MDSIVASTASNRRARSRIDADGVFITGNRLTNFLDNSQNAHRACFALHLSMSCVCSARSKFPTKKYDVFSGSKVV
jgi:hypothetical protein